MSTSPEAPSSSNELFDGDAQSQIENDLEIALKEWLMTTINLIRRINDAYVYKNTVYRPGSEYSVDVHVVIENMLTELQSIYEGVEAPDMIYEHALMAIALPLPSGSLNRSGLLTKLGLVLAEKGMIDQVENMIVNDNPLGLEYFQLNLLAEALSEACLDKGLVERARIFSNNAVRFRAGNRNSWPNIST